MSDDADLGQVLVISVARRGAGRCMNHFDDSDFTAPLEQTFVEEPHV